MIVKYIGKFPNGEANIKPQVEGVYVVYGILSQEKIGSDYLLSFYQGEKLYLNIYPAIDFVIIDNRIPANWICNFSRDFYDNGHIGFRNAFILGYEELVLSKYHFLNLIDNLTPEDINLFLLNKRGVDKWQDLQK